MCRYGIVFPRSRNQAKPVAKITVSPLLKILSSSSSESSVHHVNALVRFCLEATMPSRPSPEPLRGRRGAIRAPPIASEVPNETPIFVGEMPTTRARLRPTPAGEARLFALSATRETSEESGVQRKQHAWHS